METGEWSVSAPLFVIAVILCIASLPVVMTNIGNYQVVVTEMEDFTLNLTGNWSEYGTLDNLEEQGDSLVLESGSSGSYETEVLNSTPVYQLDHEFIRTEATLDMGSITVYGIADDDFSTVNQSGVADADQEITVSGGQQVERLSMNDSNYMKYIIEFSASGIASDPSLDMFRYEGRVNVEENNRIGEAARFISQFMIAVAVFLLIVAIVPFVLLPLIDQ